MRDYDYIVLVDENGQPYIAHSLFGNVKKAVKSAGSRAHKYIAKWGEGAKARYFYTQEELKAAMNQGKQKVKDAVDNAKQKGRDAIGITAKEKMKAASNDMRRAHAESNKDYNEYKKARRDSMRAESAAMKADAAKTYANWNVDKAKAEAARARAEVDHDRSELNKAENRYQQQHEKYYGDENSLGKTAERAVSKSAREEHAADKKKLDELNTARSDAYKTAKAGEQVLQEAYDAQRRAMSEKRMADKEADKANRDYTVSKEKRIDASYKDLESDVSSMEADQAYRRARAEYAATPLAKINAAKDKVGEAVSNAKDKVSNVVGDAKEKVKDAASGAADAAKDAKEKVKDAASGATVAAKDASSKVKSAYDRMRDEFAKKREEKDREKLLETIRKNHVEKPNITPENYNKYEAAAWYVSPKMSLDTDPNGEKQYARRLINKEGIAEDALKEASGSLKGASSIDDKRRTASEKRMAENELAGLKGATANWMAKGARWSNDAENKAEQHSADSKPKNDPKIDVSKLADNEYVYALGSNTGHAGEVKKVMDAERAYNTAMRNYNRIAASKNASGQDKNAAKREMEKMKRDYESLLNDLVDTLNKE